MLQGGGVVLCRVTYFWTFSGVGVVRLVKILLSSNNAFHCSWEGSVKSRSLCDFCNSSASARAARAALSFGSACGAGQLCGKNLTDLVIHSDLDFGRYTSWHL